MADHAHEVRAVPLFHTSQVLMKRSIEGPRKSDNERAGSAKSRVARPATDPWLPWPAQNLGSEAHRHFSGSKRLDFPVQYGPFPLQQQPEARGLPTFDWKFRSKAERDSDIPKILILSLLSPPTRDNTGYRAWRN
jgi:hypothetical protein